jgi:hypothetical protein
MEVTGLLLNSDVHVETSCPTFAASLKFSRVQGCVTTCYTFDLSHHLSKATILLFDT